MSTEWVNGHLWLLSKRSCTRLTPHFVVPPGGVQHLPAPPPSEAPSVIPQERTFPGSPSKTVSPAASPKSPVSVKDGRRAKEAGHCWVGFMQSPDPPPEVAAALASHPDFGEVTRWSVRARSPRALRRTFSGTATSTVLLHAFRMPGVEFVVEWRRRQTSPFGNTVAGSLAAEPRGEAFSTPNSKRMARMEELVRATLHAERSGCLGWRTSATSCSTATFAAALAVAHGPGPPAPWLLFRNSAPT